MGVPKSKITLENESCNTGQNVALSYTTMLNHGINMEKIIVVQMPFMERRVYATVMKQWPGNKDNLRVIVTSPAIDIEHYPTPEVGSLSEVIAKMVGCLQRVIEYPAMGFHIHQDVPPEVLNAYRKLIAVDEYTTHMFTKRK